MTQVCWWSDSVLVGLFVSIITADYVHGGVDFPSETSMLTKVGWFAALICVWQFAIGRLSAKETCLAGQEAA